MTTKRYELDGATAFMRPATLGRWVAYADVEALRAAALRVAMPLLMEAQHLEVSAARATAAGMLDAALDEYNKEHRR